MDCTPHLRGDRLKHGTGISAPDFIAGRTGLRP